MDELKNSLDANSSREALRQQQEALASRLTAGNRSHAASNDLDKSIACFSESELDSAAETLVRKRLSQTSSHLAMTRYVLSSEFVREFRQFCETHHFNGHRAHWFDAWYFAESLKKSLINPERKPWLADCLRLEQSLVGLELYNPRVSVRRLNYQVHLWQYDRDPSPTKKACLVWAWRLGRWRGIRIH
jgi:hypothetical protein